MKKGYLLFGFVCVPSSQFVEKHENHSSHEKFEDQMQRLKIQTTLFSPTSV
jgi:hypothetical protein